MIKQNSQTHIFIISLLQPLLRPFFSSLQAIITFHNHVFELFATIRPKQLPRAFGSQYNRTTLPCLGGVDLHAQKLQIESLARENECYSRERRRRHSHIDEVEVLCRL